MTPTRILKNLIMSSIIISFLATILNQVGVLQDAFGSTSGAVWNIGNIIGLIFAVIAILLVLRIPEKQAA
ncbi:MAG: hypothetical protein ACYCT2_02890 [Thermoplasmataceae archaeon]